MGEALQRFGGSESVQHRDTVAPDKFEIETAATWYIAKLKPGGLCRAETNLSRQGYRTFMPKRQISERRRGKIRPVTRPLFPGYLFVQIDCDKQHWRTINSTYGVARIVALDGTAPSQVPAGLMTGLFDRCEGDIWIPESQAFAAGTRVRLVAGPFANSLAQIAELPEADRVLVLLEMMGQSVRAQVAISDLERL